MIYLLYLALIILFAKLSEEICVRIKQPSILGYILTGILLGPAGLSVVVPEDAIKLFIDLGVVFLFFLIGFEEIEVSSLIAVFKRRLFYAAVLALSISTALSYAFLIQYGFSGLQAFAVASVFSVTSLGVLAKVLCDFGYLKEPLGLMTFTVGAIIEFLGLLLVSIAIRIYTAPENLASDLILLIISIISYFAVAVVFGIYIVPGVISLLRKYGRAKETALGILIGLILLFVVTAENSGLHGSIGALLLGVALSPLSKELHSEITRGMEGLAYGFFVPIFFVGIGLYFETSFLSLPFWLVLGIILLNTGGKFVSVLVAAKLTRIPAALPISLGLMSKGAVDIALMLTLYMLGIVQGEIMSVYTLSVLIAIVAFPTLFNFAAKRTKPISYDTSYMLTPAYLRTALGMVRAKDLMIPIFDAVVGDLTISELVKEHPDMNKNYLVIDDQARLLGSVSLREIGKVPEELWTETKVSEVMRKDLETVFEDEEISGILEKMIVWNEPLIPVVDKKDPRRVIGVISRDQINAVVFGSGCEN
ncbi:MAG: cation:proton antiporter [Candidatus Methanosuratincola sp.]